MQGLPRVIQLVIPQYAEQMLDGALEPPSGRRRQHPLGTGNLSSIQANPDPCRLVLEEGLWEEPPGSRVSAFET